MMFPFGLVSWLAAGLVLGFLAERLLPGKALMRRPPSDWDLAVALLVGIWGAFAGGILATVLGFGGLVSLDIRSAVTAALSALLLLILLRSFQLRA